MGSDFTKITEGSIVAYYCFDVADEIALERLEKILGKRPVEARLEAKKLAPKYIQYRASPYEFNLGVRKIALDKEHEVEARTTAKLYGFGAVSIIFTLPLQGDVAKLPEVADRVIDNPNLEAEAKKQVERVFKEIKEIAAGGVSSIEECCTEDYVVLHAAKIEEKPTAKKLLAEHSRDIANALAAEPKGVSEEEERDTLKQAISYYVDDLVIVDWASAFVYDPRPCDDTLDVIEYALIQSLELRAYDTVLDEEISKAYDDIAAAAKARIIFWKTSAVVSRLMKLRLDISNVLERVENALKPIGDLYLARVYRSAAARFYLDAWKASVDHKLSVVERTYEMLTSQIESTRMIVLEATIVALFILDVALYLLK